MKIHFSLDPEAQLYGDRMVSEAYALEAYRAIDAFYPKKDAAIIKNNSTLTGNTLQVDSFLANALLTGKKPYSLKEGLLASPSVKTGPAGKYLTVPVGDSFRRLTEKSEGWKHPGFFEEFYKDWVDYINSFEIIELIFQK